MRKNKLYSILLLVCVTLISKAQLTTHQIFDSNGTLTSFEDILKKAQKADIILFGELHDNPINHWLQLELTSELYKQKKQDIILGAEMFEADDQIVINEYLSGKISEKTFKEESKLWNNFATDYKPLLDFAKKNKLNFIATNVPRRYANMVYNKGLSILDSLSDESKKWIAPLPFPYDPNEKAYKEIFENAGGHGGENLPKSQAIKDATMAHFITTNLSKGKTFIHFNGAYHSNNHSAIEWYLKQYKAGLKIVVISSVEQDNINLLEKENINLGDFIICTPINLTKTYK